MPDIDDHVICPRCNADAPQVLGLIRGVVWFMCQSCSLPFHITDRRHSGSRDDSSSVWSGPERRCVVP